MKLFLNLFLTIIILSSPVFASNEEIEKAFLQNTEVPFLLTNVPRGVIASFDESLFFNAGEYKIRCSGTKILDKIGNILSNLKYVYVIEGHTTEIKNGNKYFKSNWELSLARANSIAKYLIYCSKIQPDKLFPIGFGESMPLEDHTDLKNRIDFVVIDYEY